MRRSDTEQHLTYLIGYLNEMGFDEIRIVAAVAKTAGVRVTPLQVRDHRRKFEAVFPAGVRVLLARYTLTLSKTFYDTIKPMYDRTAKEFRSYGMKMVALQYNPYTRRLLELDSDQKQILVDEMISSMAIRLDFSYFRQCSFESLIRLWLDLEMGEFTETKVDTYFQTTVGENRRLDDYKEFLHNVGYDKSTQTLYTRRAVERSVLPGVVSYIDWLRHRNPLDVAP